MDLTNVKNLQTANIVEVNDFFHILRENQYEFVDSYKIVINKFKSLYEGIETIEKYRNQLKDLFTELQSLSAQFITKEEMDAEYSRKEDFNNDKKLILTEDEMESILEGYTNKDKIKTKTNICKKEAHSTAATMTSAALKAVNKIDRTKLLLGTMMETMTVVAEE